MGKIKRYKHIINVVAHSYGTKKPKKGDIVRHIERSIEGMDLDVYIISNRMDRTYKGQK